MRNRYRVLITLLLLCLFFTVPGSGLAQQDTPVELAFFYSKDCTHCQVIMDEFLPELRQEYGTQIEVYTFEITDVDNMQLLVEMESRYGVPAEKTTIPEVFMAQDVFLGPEAIRHDLEGVIDDYLDAGKGPLPAFFHEAIAEHTADPSAIVQAVMFFMPTCGHCEEIIQNYIPLLKAEYGEQFQLGLVNVDSDAAYAEFSDYMESLSDTPQLYGVPTMVIGDTVMVGADQIPQLAESTIERYLAQGGVDYPDLPAGLEIIPFEEIDAVQISPTPAPTEIADDESDQPPIHMAYFYQSGCQECDRVQMALDFLQNRYPQLQVTAFNVKGRAALHEWLSERAGIREEKRLVAPAVFVGQDALVDEELHLDSLEALIANYRETGAAPVWDDYQEGQAEQNIIQRFRSLGVLTVVGAGLLDGLNPCAFATLIFFVSYLSFGDHSGREILWVGIAFTLGVFLTYLLVGLGLWKALGALDILTRLGRWLYIFTAVFCVILAGLSFWDYFKARRGETEEMTLKLPTALRKRINAVIRKGQRSGAFVPVAFLTGAVVSVIELACTGQVYLPTIVFVLSVPELQVRAFTYLVLYNLFFVMPLIVVFLFVYFGTTADQLRQLWRRHAATVKLGTAVLFLGLATWLTFSLVL